MKTPFTEGAARGLTYTMFFTDTAERGNHASKKVSFFASFRRGLRNLRFRKKWSIPSLAQLEPCNKFVARFQLCPRRQEKRIASSTKFQGKINSFFFRGKYSQSNGPLRSFQAIIRDDWTSDHGLVKTSLILRENSPKKYE